MSTAVLVRNMARRNNMLAVELIMVLGVEGFILSLKCKIFATNMEQCNNPYGSAGFLL